jgi:hypothetical protein
MIYDAGLPAVPHRSRSFRKFQHVGTLRVFCSAAAFVEREAVVRIYLTFEALEEGFAGWASAGAAVVGSRP